MEIKIIASILNEVVSGNLERFSLLFDISQEKISKATEQQSGLLLTQKAVLKVLNGLKTNSLKLDVTQKWASFMVRGYITSNDLSPISPIYIEYDQSAEDSIVETLSRLDELGDSVDGSIDDEELDGLIKLFNR